MKVKVKVKVKVKARVAVESKSESESDRKVEVKVKAKAKVKVKMKVRWKRNDALQNLSAEKEGKCFKTNNLRFTEICTNSSTQWFCAKE